MEPIYLIDLLSQAKINAQNAAQIEIQRVVINRDPRTVIFQHPNSSLDFTTGQITEESRLKFGIGLRKNIWELCKSPIIFRIDALEGGSKTLLFEKKIHPYKNPAHRNWMDFDLDLSLFANRTVALRFQTRAVKRADYAWSIWSNPIITNPKPAEHPPKPAGKIRKNAHPHVFLVTSDALSKRLLGCYGGNRFPTPNIDAFARESVKFEQSISQTTSTLGAYASILTGTEPEKHGLNAEWGRFPEGVLTLPVYLSAKGYDTNLITSETELTLPQLGVTPLFKFREESHCNPAQDGSITLRSFKKNWRAANLQKPQFTWIQFFDTHPPSLPPDEISRKFYSGDPTQKVNAPEKVKRVYGVESLVEMGHLPELLRAGKPLPGQIRIRLRDTAHAFLGKEMATPDLYEHLINSSKKVMLGKSHKEMGHWILEQLQWYKEHQGTSNKEFLNWLDILLPELEFIETSITSWLSGVQDFDYAVSQYGACTNYFDALFGEFIAFLKEEGIYDDALIVLTSPHGEVLSYKNIAFHHHFPHPFVYETPLLVRGSGLTPKSISGIVEHRDLFPSIMHALGRNPADEFPEITGISWWDYAREGKQIPRISSRCSDINEVLQAQYEPPFLYVRSNEPYYYSSEWNGLANDERLFKLDDTEDGMHEVENAEMMAHLRSLLDAG